MVALETSGMRSGRSVVVKGEPSNVACTIRNRIGCNRSSVVSICTTISHLIMFSNMRLTESPPLGRRIDVGNRRLWLHRSGEGEPAVIFVAGGGAMGLDYLLSQQQAAELTSCLIYDRAGTGWSEDADLPRSAEEVTDELHDLLRAVRIKPPHILVGHSLGGAYVHRHAQRFPTDIAGLLLVEPAHPDWDSYMPELVTLARSQFEGGMFDAFPVNIRELLIGRHLSRERLLVGVKEGLNVLSVMDELRAGGPLPDVPLIVLSGTAIGPEQTVFQTEDNLRAQIAGSQHLFDAIAASVSHGEHRSLSDASHVSLPMTRPDAIATAVNDVLHQLRLTGSQ